MFCIGVKHGEQLSGLSLLNVIPCLRPLATSAYFENFITKILPRRTSTFLLLSSDNNAASSTVIALNSFNQYNPFQYMELF